MEAEEEAEEEARAAAWQRGTRAGGRGGYAARAATVGQGGPPGGPAAAGGHPDANARGARWAALVQAHAAAAATHPMRHAERHGRHGQHGAHRPGPGGPRSPSRGRPSSPASPLWVCELPAEIGSNCAVLKVFALRGCRRTISPSRETWKGSEQRCSGRLHRRCCWRGGWKPKAPAQVGPTVADDHASRSIPSSKSRRRAWPRSGSLSRPRSANDHAGWSRWPVAGEAQDGAEASTSGRGICTSPHAAKCASFGKEGVPRRAWAVRSAQIGPNRSRRHPVSPAHPTPA